jgi:hypothetical protein
MNIGLFESAAQRAKRSPKPIPRYALMPQRSTDGIAASVSGLGSSP